MEKKGIKKRDLILNFRQEQGGELKHKMMIFVITTLFHRDFLNANT